MIESPERYIKDFADAGADYIAVHQEACTHLHRTVQLIREHGARSGVALNPATPVETLQWVLEDLDFVLVMSVNPGFGGQQFIPSSLEKIAQLRRMVQTRGLSTLIQVDGGVSRETIERAAAAGANNFVAGSAVYRAEDAAAEVQTLRDLASTAFHH